MVKLGLVVVQIDDGSGMMLKLGLIVVQIDDGSGMLYNVKVGTDCCSD